MDFEIPPNLINMRKMIGQMMASMFLPVARQADKTHEVPDSFIKQLMGAGRGSMSMMGGGFSPKNKKEGPKDSGTEKKSSRGGRGGMLGQGMGDMVDEYGHPLRARMGMIMAEAAGVAGGGVGMCAPGPGLGGPPVMSHGTEEQKERFFGIFNNMKEPRWGAYGLTEPSAGSDVSNIKTTAVKDGDYWILNGRKCFITNGARAVNTGWVVIFATTDKSKGREAQLPFVVEAGTPGLSVGKIEKKMGLRASETAEIVLEDCRVHKDNLLGGEKSEQEKKAGFMAAMKTFDMTRPGVAAGALGIGLGAYEYARDWCNEAYDFSRPIPRYRLIEEKLASMERRIDAMRTMIWHAAWKADAGLPNTKEASMCKAYAGKTAQEVCIDAIEVMGREGLSARHPVEMAFRDCKVYDIFEGTNQIQHIVISKRIIDGLKSF